MKTTKDELVLVTGGTGFLARHTILRLLKRGHSVRTTVRSAEKGSHLRAVLAKAGGNVERLEIAIADLMEASAWPQALTGVRHVMHLATPMQGENVLAAAMDGTRHVLKASAGVGVARVVLTSSGLAALRPGRQPAAGEFITEADWTDAARPRIDDYTRAKTLAEQDAWRFADEFGLSLISILPGAILGPALGPDSSGWLGLIGGMLAGKMKRLPPIRLQMVDVRDLADLHIQALFAPGAAGQRYIAAGEALSLREVAEILRQDLGAAGQAVSTREMPAWGLRLAGLVSVQARQAVPLLDPSPLLSSAKAERELGWVPRPIRQSVGDTARSLLG